MSHTPPHKLSPFYDIAILGGGLAGQWCLWALRKHHPNLRIVCLERASAVRTDMTWSCHRSDLSDKIFQWAEEVFSTSWDHHEVIFPEFSRVIETQYLSLRGHDLRDKVSQAFQDSLYFSIDIKKVTPLEPGFRIDYLVDGAPGNLRAASVIDCRGWKPVETRAWQKFLGLSLELSEPHGLSHVILKDALVPQIDGYRFFYILPWSETEVLVEDTYYSHHPSLKRDRIEKEILNYAERKGWKVKRVVEQEMGVLPLLTTYQTPPPMPYPILGAAGSYFHPITGYTMPFVLRQIQAILDEGSLSNRGMVRALHDLQARDAKSHRLLCFMNRVMFETFSPVDRYQLLMHFYQLPENVIQRFYRGETRPLDLFQIFLTRPPLKYREIARMWLRDRFAAPEKM